MKVTAKITCNHKQPNGDGQTVLGFCPDYADGANKEWAKYTPALGLTMTVLDSVAEQFTLGQHITLTFAAE